MTNIQEERMYELFGKEGITTNEGQELTDLVDLMIYKLNEDMKEFENV